MAHGNPKRPSDANTAAHRGLMPPRALPRATAALPPATPAAAATPAGRLRHRGPAVQPRRRQPAKQKPRRGGRPVSGGRGGGQHPRPCHAMRGKSLGIRPLARNLLMFSFQRMPKISSSVIYFERMSKIIKNLENHRFSIMEIGQTLQEESIFYLKIVSNKVCAPY